MRRPFGHPLGTRDEGFTLIEVIVAMFVVMIVMASLLGVLVSSLTTIAQARQRQTATALATQALERLRALPYDDVTQSTGASFEPGLQYVTTTAGTDMFNPAAVLTGINEALIVNLWSGHWEEQVVDEVRYKIQTYVTRAPATAAGEQPFNLTVLVSWTSSVHPAGRTTAQRSTTFSPAGCLSTAQSPFAAPCQAYFTAQAGQSLGGISIVNAIDSTQPIDGFNGTSLELALSSNSTSLLVEQTASANGGAGTSAARSVIGGTITPVGGSSVSSAVDSDPSSGASAPDADSVSQSGGSVSLTSNTAGDAGTLIATPSSSDTGTTAAAIAATTPYCVGADGTYLTTGPGTQFRPCASSQVTPSGTATIIYNPDSSLGFGGLTVPMVQVGSSGTPFRAVAAQLTSPNGSACAIGAGPTAAGCSHSAASRTLGTVLIGGLGSGGVAPAGFDPALGLWSVIGFNEKARAEEGTAARAPFYERSGTLRIWDGTTYQTVVLADWQAPATGAMAVSQTTVIAPTIVTYTAGSGAVLTFTYEGTVTVQRPQMDLKPATRSGNPITDCKTDACVSTVNSGGAVYGNVTVTITKDATPIGTFAIATNLGGLVARSTYKAAPNA